MAAEYLVAKEAALIHLRSSCIQNLKHIQASGFQTEFSFTDHWKPQKQDESTHPSIPIANRFSRIFLNFHKRTWATYTYKDGNISAQVFQDIGGSTESVAQYESVQVENVPFREFSEADLVTAAQIIDARLQPARAAV